MHSRQTEHQLTCAKGLIDSGGGITALAAPLGAGKFVIIERVLEGRTHVITLDFSNMDEHDFIEGIAESVGMFHHME